MARGECTQRSPGRAGFLTTPSDNRPVIDKRKSVSLRNLKANLNSGEGKKES